MELVWNSFWKKVWNSDTRGFQMFSTLWRKMEDTHKKENLSFAFRLVTGGRLAIKDVFPKDILENV